MQTFAGSALVGNYQLTYQQGASTNRSRLTSVQKCGGDGACLPATTFGWTDSTNSVVQQTNLPGIGGNPPYFQLNGLSDFNGDGKTDVLWLNNSNYSEIGNFVWLSNPSGGLTVVGGALPEPAYESPSWPPSIGDFNGNGLSDILWYPSPLQSQLWLSNGDGTFAINTLNGLPANSTCGWVPFVADFNGDGRADILWDCETGIIKASIDRVLWLSNGDGTFTVFTNLAGLDGQYGSSGGYGWVIQVADLNGDGKADIFFDYEDPVGHSAGSRIAWLSNGDGTFQVITNLGGLDGSFADTYNTSNAATMIGWVPIVSSATDFNGDGKADIFWNYVDYWGNSNGARAVWISHGDGTFTVVTNLAGQDGGYVPSNYNGQGYYGWIPHIADLNGDGRADIFWDYVTPARYSAGQRIAWLSNGDGTFTVIDNFGGLGGSYASGWTYE
jgi:hypothetical protein